MILYLDCGGGASGDMLAAALCAAAQSLGRVGEGHVAGALAACGIDAGVARFAPRPRGGMDALGFDVEDRPGFATFDALEAAVTGSSLPDRALSWVIGAARRMAAAETVVHGAPDPHLHELAGIDTVVDLVAVCSLVDWLAPERVLAAPPALGSGWVAGGHGLIPVPTPAVLAVFAGLPTGGGIELGSGELTTPTGAALLAELVDDFAPLPAGRLAAVGIGSGTREIEGRANVLRALVVESAGGTAGNAGTALTRAPEADIEAADGHRPEALTLLETTVDDLSAEYLAAAADTLRAAGARDAWLTPALMKKGRPGVTLHVLAQAEDVDRLARLLFVETTTFGVRVAQIQRLRLDERFDHVAVDGQAVGIRLGFLDGHLITASPEFEDCRRAGKGLRLPARLVYERAQAAARSRFADG